MNSAQLHHQALAAIRSGADEEALAAFAEALALQPAQTAIRLDCARFLACLFRFQEALVHAGAARDALPGEPAVARAAAGVAATCRAPELALEWLRQHPDHAACRFDAAVLLERIGDLDAAAAHLAAAEQAGGQTVDGRLLAARLHSRAGRPADALELLDHLLGRAPARQPVMARIHYARGHALDRLGEYDQAFAAWSAAKAQLLPMSGDLLPASIRNFGVVREVACKITPRHLAAWREEIPPTDSSRPLLLTGFIRSGTTLLEHLLRRHAGLASADENTAFRDLVHRHTGLDETDAHRLWQGLADLRPADQARRLATYQTALGELSGAAQPTPWIIEKNPQLLPALPMLLRLMPHLPVLIIHRDPRDVMLSCFSQDFGLNHHSVHFLALADTARRLAAVRSLADIFHAVMETQMCVTRYETLLTRTHEEIARITRHFDIPTGSPSPLKATPVSYSPTYAEVAKPVHTTAQGRWKSYARHLEPHFEPLAAYLE